MAVPLFLELVEVGVVRGALDRRHVRRGQRLVVLGFPVETVEPAELLDVRRPGQAQGQG